MTTINISASTPYDILTGPGLLAEAGARIARVIDPCRVALVTDERVDALYGEQARASLEAAGFCVRKLPFAGGEAGKTLDTLGLLLHGFAEHGMGRQDAVVCLGGGVVGDVGGFAAAVYARGIRCAQIPTTLLSALDSSVGGKTAVNLPAAKNMAGAFHQPSLVLCDTDILRALPGPLRTDGAAEAIKCGVLQDPGLLQLISEGALRAEIECVVQRCVRIKRDFVQNDERELGRRQLLNLGHTIGHALERCSNYELSHGAAVGIGLLTMARAAHALGESEEDCAPPIQRALLRVGLPTESPLPGSALLPAMLLDKKRSGDGITLVVPRRIGHCALVRIPTGRLGDWLEAGGIR